MDAAEKLNEIDQQLSDAIDLRQWDRAVFALQNGANPDVVNPRNRLTALQNTVRIGYVPMVRELLAHGADANLVSPAESVSGRTPMHTAVTVKNPLRMKDTPDEDRAEMIRLLHQCGGKIDKQDGENFTPLMRGLTGDYPRACRTLVGLGADPGEWRGGRASDPASDQAMREYGNRYASGNPVHIAAMRGGVDELNIVVWAGGTLSLRNPEGRDAKALAKRRGNEMLCDRIRHFETHALYQELVPQRPLTLKTLTVERAQHKGEGRCMLDHPAVWRAPTRLFSDLKESGDVLTKEQILAPRSEAGSWLGMAIASRALTPLLAHLAEQGEVLEARDLLVDGNPETPRPEVEWIADYQDLPKLVTHWRDAEDPQLLLRNLRELPPLATDQIPIHQLIAMARRDLRGQVVSGLRH